MPFTVKLRRGLDDSAESRDNFFAIFDGAFARGAVAATVHGRTVRQRYEGPQFLGVPPRSEASCRVADRAGQRRPVHAAGLPRHDRPDRRGRRDLARGAIGNPWIFAAGPGLGRRPAVLVPPDVLAEQRAVIAEHYRLAEELYGPKYAAGRMRKFGIKYSSIASAGRAKFATPSWPSAARPSLYAVLERWYGE